ncbi:MAG TPA: cobalamin-binding protein [Nitrospirales bacterium]|nr:cobalamin-binding protein [Nitrospirales bacterium]HIO69826.1 cobalamin-binding protein [Nitrospirales bacterium]
MRIVSLLPSATEIAYALGLEEHIVGVTHECDYPPQVKAKPVVVRSTIDTPSLHPAEIDAAVSQRLKDGKSLYQVDENMLRELSPDIILTQDLCQVCAPSGDEIARVLKVLPHPPHVVWLTPTCLNDIFESIVHVGKETGTADEATQLVTALRKRVDAVANKRSVLQSPPRVFCMEWLTPPFTSGHWMPELVELVGGVDGLAPKGKPSMRIAWEQIVEYAPEVLILNPCGFDLRGTVNQAHLLTAHPGWSDLPAVQTGRVYAVDANSYFARPGPRVVDGLELLASLIQPKQFDWLGPSDAYQSLSVDDIATPSSVS